MAAPELDPANTWIVSDTHFGHQNIIGFCHRPPEHEEAMIQEWRDEVPPEAAVVHLGDLSWKNNAWFKNLIAPNLTGARKFIILGNHDKQRYSFYRDSGFKIIKPFEITYAERRVTFDHYPLKRPPHPKQVHLHGHIHNNGYGGKDSPFTPFAAQQINLSVEQTKYRPVNLKALLDGYLFGCYEPEKQNARQ